MQTINFEDFEKEELKPHLTRLRRAFNSSKRVVAITGAGISVSAGIPDFRSAGGLYEQVKLKYAPNQKLQVKGKDFFDISFFRSAETRPLFFQFIAELKEACQRATPTPTHLFLKRMAEEGRLMRWYTQNIDCLEERMGLTCFTGVHSDDNKDKADDIPLQSINTTSSCPSSVVVTLHGTLSQVACTQCRSISPLTPGLFESFRSGVAESCTLCQDQVAAREAAGKRRIHRVGLLRPDIVLYNEPHPHGEVIADFISADLSKLPGLLIVMGTSLKIAGLKKMVKDFAKAMRHERSLNPSAPINNFIIFVNKTPAPKAEWQGVFDYELIGECDAIMTKLIDELKNTPKVDPKVSKASKASSAGVGIESSMAIEAKANKKIIPSCRTEVRKPIIKKGKGITTVSVKTITPSSIVSDSVKTITTSSIVSDGVKTITTSTTSSIVTTSTAKTTTIAPESPVLSHSKSKLQAPTSPLPPHRISDFFSPVKANATTANVKKTKKPEGSKLTGIVDGHAVMGNLEI